MTCIAGIALSNGEVWIGGDSAATSAHSQQTIVAGEKVFLVRNEFDELLLGCSTSFRMIDLLKYSLQLPRYNGGDIHRYMVVEFVDAVRRCLKDGGFAKKESEREEGGDFLIAFRGRLFEVANNYHVVEAACRYTAVGSADDLALGALYATQDLHDPAARLSLVLHAAACHNSDVREPFVIRHPAPYAASSSLLD